MNLTSTNQGIVSILLSINLTCNKCTFYIKGININGTCRYESDLEEIIVTKERNNKKLYL